MWLVELFLHLEQYEWVLLDTENPLLERLLLTVGSLDGLVDGIDQTAGPLSLFREEQIHEGVGQ